MKGLINGLQHIGIPTNNMADSESFYEGLGFKSYYKTFSKSGGHWVLFMKLGNLVLEFYEMDHPSGLAGAFDHISLDCNDIESVYRRAQERGDCILSDGIESREFGEKGVRYIIIEGPNKERLEINEDVNVTLFGLRPS